VLDIGGKARRYMTNNINYTDAPAEIEKALESAVSMEDFLPSPSELVRKTEKEKITIAVDKRSLDLFKQYAKKHDAKYQTMINGVLESYAGKFLSHK
jgi:predicted DNA binding CopG/RHH family protein